MQSHVHALSLQNKCTNKQIKYVKISIQWLAHSSNEWWETVECYSLAFFPNRIWHLFAFLANIGNTYMDSRQIPIYFQVTTHLKPAISNQECLLWLTWHDVFFYWPWPDQIHWIWRRFHLMCAASKGEDAQTSTAPDRTKIWIIPSRCICVSVPFSAFWFVPTECVLRPPYLRLCSAYIHDI